jgi:hypothetical protein
MLRPYAGCAVEEGRLELKVKKSKEGSPCQFNFIRIAGRAYSMLSALRLE